MDHDGLRRVSGFHADGVLSRLLLRLLRRPALRAEGSLARDCAAARAPQLAELVSTSLSVSLRDLPVRHVMIGRARHDPASLPAPSAVASRSEFVGDVRRGLLDPQKYLQAKYFYDALGSQLFEAICDLPWYRITRAERRLLSRFSEAMVQPIADLATVMELGCGNGAKLATLVEGIRRRPAPRIHLLDISATALDLSTRTLARLPNVS